MKCPNCRCIVPNNTEVCCYCGYVFDSGSSKTQTVIEYYYDRMADYYECDHNSFDGAATYIGGNLNVQYSTTDNLFDKDELDIFVYIEILLVIVAAALILCLVALII